ncbi:MAG TPA: hypothetical protein VKW08_07890 [Xanthobacteraceae bacterium]|jgi:hypothetical protein|nr:hypothetical protein [Xanthobacteraceae bacterium]
MISGYPDLQKLIAEHDSYQQIPGDAWRRFDEAVANWNARYRRDLPRVEPRR